MVPPPRPPSVPPPPGSLEVLTTAEATVVVAAGDLDLAVTDDLAALLDRLVRQRPAALVFDASAVTFCAARVVTILVDATADAVLNRVPFAVAGRSRSLLRPIAVLGLDRVVPVHRDAAEALAWLAVVPLLTER
ncbi:STAS domain-containing protein [Amycolatopsis sp. NPDC048633]|uniref:STAS domain-containing protein n=1 Tax=Amycolatopsis sp. NPDC048633 TaxID=3157095 RepID=UPI0033C6DB12